MVPPAMDPFMIIGSGAAGMAAIQGIREFNPDVPIIILSQEANQFYSKPGLAYWLTGQIPEKQLFPQLPQRLDAVGASFVNTVVRKIDPETCSVCLADGRRLRYGKLLLVTGSQAIRPRIEGIDLEGVVTLDTLEDARKILKLARKAKRAVVVGGGITALELAEGLCARGVETHYLLRKDRYWGSVLDEDESSMVERRLLQEGIRLHFRAELQRIAGDRGRVAGALLSNGEEIPCNLVGVAVGIKPRIELAKLAGIGVDRGILVNEHLETSIEGVFAAGDAAQVWDPETQTHVLDSLWWIAREQGLLAGRNMAGAGEAYQRRLPFNVTRIGGITTTLIGRIGGSEQDGDLVSIARGDSETWRTSSDAFAVEQAGEDNRIRLLVGERHLVGAVVMGDQALSRPLQHLIGEKVDIRVIRKQLLEQPGQLIPLIEGLWMQRHAG